MPFAEELLSAMRTPEARLAALTTLARWAGRTIYLPSESRARKRERAAVHMLQNGMLGADAVQALRERFGVCQRTAWSDVKAAKKICIEVLR